MNTTLEKFLIATCMALSACLTLPASAQDNTPQILAESFNRALTAGDEKTVRALLLPEVLIYESGGVEASFDEYAQHHLPADIAFMRQTKRERVAQTIGGNDTTAWVATRSRFRGRIGDKDIDLDSTETLVLNRTADGWRIAHIHWSSAPHRPVPPTRTMHR